MRADRSIGNTALIGLLEETHGVSAKNGTMKWWRGRNKLVMPTPMADLPLHEACDAYDALFGPSADAMIAIDDTDSTIPGTSSVAISIEPNVATGIGPTSATEDITTTANNGEAMESCYW